MRGCRGVRSTDSGPVLVTVSVGGGQREPAVLHAGACRPPTARCTRPSGADATGRAGGRPARDDLLVAGPRWCGWPTCWRCDRRARGHVGATHPEQVADLAGRIASGSAPRRRGAALPARRLAARHRHDRGARRGPGQARGAGRGGVGARAQRTRSAAQEMVASVSALADAALGVRHHHERLDGSGYPDGLREDEIPFEARVVAVADAYSAMTWERPFRRRRIARGCPRRARAGSPAALRPRGRRGARGDDRGGARARRPAPQPAAGHRPGMTFPAGAHVLFRQVWHGQPWLSIPGRGRGRHARPPGAAHSGRGAVRLPGAPAGRAPVEREGPLPGARRADAAATGGGPRHLALLGRRRSAASVAGT